MTFFKKIFVVGYVAIVVLFGFAAFGLVAFAGMELWAAFDPTVDQELAKRFNRVLTSIAILTVALASFELADTVIEEEFKRQVQMSVQARAGRVLSRFLVVVIVALAVESLVAVFKFVHDDPPMLFYAASIAVAAAALLAGWGFFNRANRRDSLRPGTRSDETDV